MRRYLIDNRVAGETVRVARIASMDTTLVCGSKAALIVGIAMTPTIRAAFEPQTRVVSIDAILATRTVSPATRLSIKYRRIHASIQSVGVVEPIVVFPQPGTSKSKQYLLLDGHLRLDVLRESGATEVLCLISTDDEAF